MAREFRPYINKSLGQLPNLNIRYVIGDGEIKTYKAFLGLGESYKGSHVISEKTKVNAKDSNILGYGKVIVSTEGDTDEYENIGNVKGFISAIEAEVASIKQEAKKQLKAEDNGWYRHLTDEDLEGYVYLIPELPDSFWNLKYLLSPAASSSLNDKTDYGLIYQWHKAGEAVMSYQGVSVLAPVKGMYYGERNSYVGSCNNLLDRMVSTEGGSENVMCLFSPQKGQLSNAYWASAYPKQIDIAKFISSGKLPFHCGKGDVDIQQLRDDYQRFQTSLLEKVEISELPQLIKGLEASDFAPGALK